MPRGRPALPMPQRFWVKVDQNGPIPAHKPELGPCWIWKSTTNNGGYGLFCFLIDGQRGCTGAHRQAWELDRGPIPAGALVLHHCDNPPCCNPKHLFLGTYLDKSADMVTNGQNSASIGIGPQTFKPRVKKLSVADVHMIRHLYDMKHPLAMIAARYGLNTHYTGLVARRKVKTYID